MNHHPNSASIRFEPGPDRPAPRQVAELAGDRVICTERNAGEFSSHQRFQPPYRAGTLLLELMVAGSLLAVVMAAVIPTLGWIVRQRKFNQERQSAVMEIENLMERLTALEFRDLNPERAAQFKLSESLEMQLSEPRLSITVDSEEDGAKHLLIELSWQIGPSRAAPPVRLAASVYRR